MNVLMKYVVAPKFLSPTIMQLKMLAAQVEYGQLALLQATPVSDSTALGPRGVERTIVVNIPTADVSQGMKRLTGFKGLYTHTIAAKLSSANVIADDPIIVA